MEKAESTGVLIRKEDENIDFGTGNFTLMGERRVLTTIPKSAIPSFSLLTHRLVESMETLRDSEQGRRRPRRS